jgi:hypothetical protein
LRCSISGVWNSRKLLPYIKMQNNFPVRYVIPFCVIALLWVYALAWAILGHPIYRDQHLSAALEYSADGIDLLRPVAPSLNSILNYGINF